MTQLSSTSRQNHQLGPLTSSLLLGRISIKAYDANCLGWGRGRWKCDEMKHDSSECNVWLRGPLDRLNKDLA